MNIKIFLGRVFSFRNAKTAALALGGIAVFLFLVLYGLSWYGEWKGRQGVENLAKMLKKIEAEDYKLAMADTYGGETPQETLQMYIDAVEKGDFELASKYFIGDKQEKELKSLKNSELKDIENVLNILKKVKIIDNRAMLEKSYDKEVKEHSISESKEDYTNRLYEIWDYDKKAWMDTQVDGYDFSVSFKKYPNNIWKIIEF